MAELSGRTALITGAGQNVGAETARVLARHGARVIVNDLLRLSVYAASKGAGPAFMRCLAKEVGRNGITCNTLSLAIQGNAAWLTSDSGSWVTGQTIPVNGGYASS